MVALVPALNFIETIDEQYRAYGSMSYAFADFITDGMVQNLYAPEFLEETKLVDPANNLEKM